MFVGKTAEGAATVSLADAAGKPRLTLKVEADGQASIEFLDAERQGRPAPAGAIRMFDLDTLDGDR